MDEFQAGDIVLWFEEVYVVLRVGSWDIVQIAPLGWEKDLFVDVKKVDRKTLTKDEIGTLLYG